MGEGSSALVLALVVHSTCMPVALLLQDREAVTVGQLGGGVGGRQLVRAGEHDGLLVCLSLACGAAECAYQFVCYRMHLQANRMLSCLGR